MSKRETGQSKWNGIVRFAAEQARCLGRDSRGTVAIIFGLMAMPLIGLGGAALDYSRAASAHTKLIVALDAAVLTVALEAADKGSVTVSTEKVDKLVRSMMAGEGWVRIDEVKAEMVISKKDGTPRVRGTAKGSVKTVLFQLAGHPEVPIGAGAEVALAPPAYAEIHLVVDVSASMGLAADDDGRKLLKQKTQEINGKECTFACHMKDDPNHKKTNLEIAQENNIRTRIDVVRSVSGTLLDDVKAAQAKTVYGADSYRVGLYTFSGWGVDKGGATTLSAPTSNVEAVRPRIPSMKLDNATAYKPMLQDMTKIIGASEDGSKTDKRKKFMILLTDGHDYGHDWDRSSTIDPHDCRKLKKNGVELFVFNTMWVADWGNWAFDPILGYKNNPYGGGTVFQALGPKLKECSSGETYYFEGTDSAQISANFRMIFRAIQDKLRISQ